MTVTRGNGLLENFLAQRRSDQARKLMRRAQARGPLLDLGCGAVPKLLLDVLAEHWADDLVGMERFPPSLSDLQKIRFVLGDAAGSEHLPFQSGTFGTVTMLAVLEHLPEGCLDKLTNEISRILRPGGLFILTTPAAGTELLLAALARIRFLSPIEISEHEQLYDKRYLRRMVSKSRFDSKSVRVGSFELGMNNWLLAATATSAQPQRPFHSESPSRSNP